VSIVLVRASLTIDTCLLPGMSTKRRFRLSIIVSLLHFVSENMPLHLRP